MNKLKYYLIALLPLCFSLMVSAQSLLKVEINEDDILLLDVSVDKAGIASSIDAYQVHNRLLIAIEPLFDSLKLRYQLVDNKLTIWKDDELFEFDLITQSYVSNANKDKKPLLIWTSDGFYQFMELQLIAEIFDILIENDLTRQVVAIDTRKNSLAKRIDDSLVYLFPIQKLALLSERRQFNRFYNSDSKTEVKKNAITIADEYRLFTLPHGRINAAANLKEQQFNGSVQLVSDLLYHSANLTMSQSEDTDLSGSLSLSRFKSAPDQRIFGLFDSYTLGDVSGVSNNLTTSSASGLGGVFRRSPDGYRRNNRMTTLNELAPPGWDAELFHNGTFLERTIVPADGRLIFENKQLDYGINNFEIRLYGPFGEEEFINNKIDVKQNALSEGQIAYKLNALDNKHKLINDKNRDEYEITNWGGEFDYGITDQWQTGFSFVSIDNEQKLFSLKNSLSFNNMLIENQFSINQNSSYAQITTIQGSIFYNDSYSLTYQSAEEFEIDKLNYKGENFSRYAAQYSLPVKYLSARFALEFREDDNVENLFLTNQLSKSFGNIRLSHTLNYNKTKPLLTSDGLTSTEQLTGTLGVNGRVNDFFVSGIINYNPELSDPILKSSSIRIQKTIEDPYENKHYINANYYPLSSNGTKWQLRHNVAFDNDEYYLTFSTAYDSNDNWNINLGIQFFIGYDYRNKKIILNNEFRGGSATLDVHSYLDRQLNGVPDVLDYNLENVSFSGNPNWDDFKSGTTGRTILPGVYGNSEFAFSAKWQEGSHTVNNNYMVYTHPGAYIDVNMPFYLITDLTGFVIRLQDGDEIGLRNVEMQLLDADNKVVQTTETDEDGYYEFLQLIPSNYKVQVAKGYLQIKGFTSDVIGANVSTSGRGGFVELPSVTLRRISKELGKGKEENITFILNEDNVDALVWDEDEEKNRNYFTLPSKGEIAKKHSLTQPVQLATPEANIVDINIEDQLLNDGISVKKEKIKAKPAVLNLSAVLLKAKEKNSLLPQLRIKAAPLKTEHSDKVLEELSETSPTILSPPKNKVEINIEKTSLNGWSIQFQASKAAISNARAKNDFSAIGNLYTGVKQTASGINMNCIFSDNFISKAAANKALLNSGLDGWIVERKIYSDIKKIN
ncbi:MAG: SdrD B-like domain-containing protein [Colwellia sp.]|nr:SdrD B-like domain-containing protein [Colwellia sp.]